MDREAERKRKELAGAVLPRDGGMEGWRLFAGSVCEVLTTLVEQNINYSRENQLRSVRLSF